MGNSLTVDKPYIIDEYPSDDDGDDDDDDEFSYDTALEPSGSQDQDCGGDSKGDNTREGVTSAGDGCLGQQISLDSKIVSHLVRELEQLLNFLENDDFENAQKAAKFLRSGHSGTTVFSEEVQDLPEALQGTRQLEISHEEEEEETSQTVTEDFKALQSESTLESSATLISNEFSEEEFLALAKLDEDLSQFEEDESRIINNQNGAQFPKREKSSIPTLRSATSRSVGSVEEEEPNGSPVIEHKVFVPIQKETSRSRVSAIPRFSSSSSVEEKIPHRSLSEEDDVAAAFSKIVENEVREEKQETVEANGQDITTGSSASNASGLELEDEEVATVSREVKVVIESQNTDDDVIKVTDTSAWEINISDFTGRAKRNKKRSGIPSLWTDAGSKSTTKTYPEEKPISPSPTTSSPSSPEATTTSSSPPPKIPEIHRTSITSSSTTEVSSPGQRKIFDLKRWMCISRPQYKTSCGISSVVSCWNLLFSTLGHGSLAPLSQEEAMKILGFKAPYEKIRFGPHTGNLTLLRWFRELTNHFNIRGRCYIMFKPNGRNRTIGVTDKMALDKLKAGLQDPNTAFVYHCHNHYFCPMGYEESPNSAKEAYSGKLPPELVNHTWILIGDTSRKYGPFHCKSWEEICQDLHMNGPEYINIRKSWLGVLKKKSRKSTGNLHCIMCFQKPKDLQSFIPTTGNSQTRSSTGIPRSSRLPRRSPSPSSRRSGEGEFRFSGDSREAETDEDWDEEVENLTSDVSSDEDVRRRRK